MIKIVGYIPLDEYGRALGDKQKDPCAPPIRHFDNSKQLKRKHDKCYYCKRLFDVRKPTIDHIIPISRGGSNNSYNTVKSCGLCNSLKADFLPDELLAELISFINGSPVTRKCVKTYASKRSARIVQTICCNLEKAIKRISTMKPKMLRPELEDILPKKHGNEWSLIRQKEEKDGREANDKAIREMGKELYQERLAVKGMRNIGGIEVYWNTTNFHEGA